MLDGTEFSNTTAYETAYAYNYPWGDTHNGGARMIAAAPFNAINTSGQLDFQAVRLATPDGVSVQGQTINYYSGTCYARDQITVTTTTPNWVIKGDFQIPTVFGTWPAFWITGVNNWPPEADQMEFKGDTTNWQNVVNGRDWTDLHWWTVNTIISDAYTAWHNYEVHLDLIPGTTNITITMFIDDVQTGQTTGANWLNAPLWLILDFQTEGASGTPGPSNTVYFRAKNVIVQYYRAEGITTPAIAQHPKNTSLSSGDFLSLSVTATGGDLSYQWSKDGTAISGATASSYAKSSVTVADAGSYTVVATNSAGSVTSSVAAVTVTAVVTPPPPPPSSGSGGSGGGGALSDWFIGALALLTLLRTGFSQVNRKR